MRTTYDVTQPRISIRDPVSYDAAYPDRSMEIGQAAAMGEAMFFLSIGYTISVAEWDGKCYRNRCNYLPGDM
jgi:hypothetical protein